MQAEAIQRDIHQTYENGPPEFEQVLALVDRTDMTLGGIDETQADADTVFNTQKSALLRQIEVLSSQHEADTIASEVERQSVLAQRSGIIATGQEIVEPGSLEAVRLALRAGSPNNATITDPVAYRLDAFKDWFADTEPGPSDAPTSDRIACIPRNDMGVMQVSRLTGVHNTHVRSDGSDFSFRVEIGESYYIPVSPRAYGIPNTPSIVRGTMDNIHSAIMYDPTQYEYAGHQSTKSLIVVGERLVCRYLWGQFGAGDRTDITTDMVKNVPALLGSYAVMRQLGVPFEEHATKHVPPGRMRQVMLETYASGLAEQVANGNSPTRSSSVREVVEPYSMLAKNPPYKTKAERKQLIRNAAWTQCPDEDMPFSRFFFAHKVRKHLRS